MSDFSVRENIEKLSNYIVEHVEAKIIVDVNESNYPMPEEVKIKIQKAMENFLYSRYPSFKGEELVKIIADELDVTQDNVQIGNGASDLLQKLCYVFGGNNRKIAYPVPSLPLYERFIKAADSTPAPYCLNSDGYIDADKVIDFCKKTGPSLLLICNPNNPTGNYNSIAVIEKIIANVSCPVIIDETYIEFADGKEIDSLDLRPLNKIWLVAGSVVTLVGRYSNVVCIRSFSKAYGLAGLRCGYAIGANKIMHLLDKVIMPYSVSSYTLMAAKMVYENKEFYRPLIKSIVYERKTMLFFLKNHGFETWPSEGNFILFRAGESLSNVLAESYDEVYGSSTENTRVKSGKFIYRYLLKNGILAADFSEYDGLHGCIRITIGLPEENTFIKNQLSVLCYEQEKNN